MGSVKRIGKAFIVGGVAGFIGQILMVVVGKFCPADFVTPVAMLIFGILSIFVISSGLYLKIAQFGGDGAAIPLCGLMFGAAMAAGGAKAQGASSGKAWASGFLAIIKVLGVGFIVSLILGLIFK